MKGARSFFPSHSAEKPPGGGTGENTGSAARRFLFAAQAERRWLSWSGSADWAFAAALSSTFSIHASRSCCRDCAASCHLCLRSAATLIAMFCSEADGSPRLSGFGREWRLALRRLRRVFLDQANFSARSSHSSR